MVERFPFTPEREPSFEEAVMSHFLGGISADDVLVRSSQLLEDEYAAQISLEYRMATSISEEFFASRMRAKTLQERISERHGQPALLNIVHHLTFTRNILGLYVDTRPGILYGGSILPVRKGSFDLKTGPDLGYRIICRINCLVPGSKGKELYDIGSCLLNGESARELVIGLKESNGVFPN